jgi:hypothetical protein
VQGGLPTFNGEFTPPVTPTFTPTSGPLVDEPDGSYRVFGLGESDAKGGGMGVLTQLQTRSAQWLGRKRRAMAYHPSAIPALPVFPLPEICPECQGPLTDPDGQDFIPLFPEASSPSKVCEACGIGYWLEDIGWMSVATFTVPRGSRPPANRTRSRRTARSR